MTAAAHDVEVRTRWNDAGTRLLFRSRCRCGWTSLWIRTKRRALDAGDGHVDRQVR